jgi:hypothetical protein
MGPLTARKEDRETLILEVRCFFFWIRFFHQGLETAVIEGDEE